MPLQKKNEQTTTPTAPAETVASENATPAAETPAAPVAPTKPEKSAPTIYDVPNNAEAIATVMEDWLKSCAAHKREPRLSVTKTGVRLTDGNGHRWDVNGDDAAANVAAALPAFAGDARWKSSGTKDGWQTCRFLLRRDAKVEVAKAPRSQKPPKPAADPAAQKAAAASVKATAASTKNRNAELAAIGAAAAPRIAAPDGEAEPKMTGGLNQKGRATARKAADKVKASPENANEVRTVA